MPETIDCPDLAATEAFGRAFAARLRPGDVVGLDGPLGAGKTHLVKAIAQGLGLRNPALVTSPTFVLIQEYPARLPIYHFDAYRLESSQAFLDLGADEYLNGDGVCLIEWASKVRDVLPRRTIMIAIEVTGQSQRRVTVSAE